MSSLSDDYLQVIAPVSLHEGHRDFFIHAMDSQGGKMILPVKVLYDENYHQQHLTEVDSDTNTEVGILILLSMK